ncbi:polysaccharide biosynthesis protein [Desulfofarcimen acetoxidans DSM 771]|uniref:Polysaccharide biosynthesis protein n=1 Tax=Desulfofarcimen acetoxidans (strain ATCC 49208 / DSM 771 / KCTC 5769 / VKM B-1644 / 5575) TaxID=485916 RepID=C8VYP3_DESAS|nr:flippase [Desulfofarcimen acetoxidans]ACV64764.1 polysaccharide biosynthesis protein [Desulfofarcimen acetoxidans DSM 771]
MREEKELIKKSVYMFIMNGIGKALLVLANIFMARLLGAKIYGEFVYVFAIITIIPIISRFGLDQGLLKYIPQNEVDNNNEINKSISLFAILFSLALSFFVMLIILYNIEYFSVKIFGHIKYRDGFKNQMYLLLILTEIYIFASLFQARGKMRIYSFAMNFLQNGIFLLALGLLYMMNLEGFFIPIIAKYIACGCTLLFLIYKAIRHRFIGQIGLKNMDYYIDVLKFSFPLVLVGSLSVLIDKTSIYMVGYYLDDVSVGIYNSAAQIAVIPSFMLTAINQVFAPMISTLYYKREINKINNIYSKINYLMLVTVLIIMFIIILCSDLIMIIYGREYSIGSTCMIIIAGGQLFNAISGPCGLILTMTGYSNYNLYINISMIILIVIFSSILIPMYGIEGAAFSSTGSIIITNVLRMIFMHRKVGIVPFAFKKI